jgi:hypothetical protein
MKTTVLWFLLSTSALAQWTFVGYFPKGGAPTTTYDQAAQPYWRGFTSAVYDDLDRGLLISESSPAVSGLYVNTTFLYTVGTNQWKNLYSHTTSGNTNTASITALSRRGGIVSATLAKTIAWPVDPNPQRYLGIGTCSVNNTRPAMSDPSFATSPVAVNQIDSLHFTYPKAGPDTTLSCSNNNCGCAWGILDSPDSPSDGEIYHQKAWDNTRHVLWKAFGTSSAYLTGGTTYALVGQAKSTYQFNTSTGGWTEVCGDLTSPCNVPDHEQSAMAYFPDTDRIVLTSGFNHATKVADTWELNPATGKWALICTPSTCGNGSLVHTHGSNLAYFPKIHKAVLVGGQVKLGTSSPCQNNSGQSCNTQTWLYDSANAVAPSWGWTLAATAHTIPGIYFPIVDYDPDKNVIVLVDENQSGSHVWKFDGTDWTDITAQGLIARGPIMSVQGSQNFGAYDPFEHAFVVMFKSDSQANQQIWKLVLP